jgi:UDP-glucose 4-epimerase
MKTIMIAGGAGYIGSHIVADLHSRNYDVLVVDNLSEGHKEAIPEGVKWANTDISDTEAMSKLFSKHDIEAVMHFAAYTYVGESVSDPQKYYKNNVMATISLLEAMLKHNVKNFIFSSSCAIYGNPQYMPMDEAHPQQPISPYGASKSMVERILADYSKAYGLRYAAMRYFNAAGAAPDGSIGESHRIETHLIPLVMEAICGKRAQINVFGTDYDTPDGTCVRDYVHVCDLATAHRLAMEKLIAEGESFCLNLGSGVGNSVKEIISACEAVIGKPAPVIYGERRAGDPARLLATCKAAEDLLGFKPEYTDIRTTIETAWNWEQNKRF